jgi:menaquinone-specific isochorismate synthase
VADQIDGVYDAALAEVERRAAELPGAGCYLGGVRFAPARTMASEWQDFGAAHFSLPRTELRVSEGGAVLSANLVFPRDARQPERVLAELNTLRWPVEALSGELPMPVDRADAPGRAPWRDGIEAALRALDATPLEKVVLARRATYTFDDPLDPYVLLNRLEAATPSCFHFLVQPAPGVAFLGASPERLFRREGRTLTSEAVAGTRPRGASDAADARLREELQLSEKDQREHGFVREQIRRALTPFSDTLDVDAETSDMMLARGRHLYSGIAATLKADVRSTDLLRALHPTPAVGGTPTANALRMIAEVEPFDRGWYAGPVGWIGADAAEFAVGIRSGLVENGEKASLSLYSGAGIVRGSEAEAEWAEIEHKIGDFARVLALDA